MINQFEDDFEDDFEFEESFFIGRDENVYRIIRLTTENQNNKLGVIFSKDENDSKIEIIKWPMAKGEIDRISKVEILN
jgi:hypothetical protein